MSEHDPLFVVQYVGNLVALKGERYPIYNEMTIKRLLEQIADEAGLPDNYVEPSEWRIVAA